MNFKTKLLRMAQAGGALSKVVTYAIIIVILGVLAGLGVMSVASAGLVSAQVTMAEFTVVVVLLIILEFIGVRYRH